MEVEDGECFYGKLACLHGVSSCSYSLFILMCGGAERSSGAFAEAASQRAQSEDEDAESIAEKLDIFPPSRSGYTQKVEILCRIPARHCRHILACSAPTLLVADFRS